MTGSKKTMLDYKYKMWRIRAFAGTWLAYAGFYFCRKSIAVAQPEFIKEFGWTNELVGIMLSSYSIAYMAGQFINGALADKYGPRKILFFGFIITILANIAFGFSYTITAMTILWTINGYAQACGWPSVIKGMANWFSLRERGKVMGLWGPSYAVGDVVGTSLAAFVISRSLTKTIENPVGEMVVIHEWRWVFWIAAVSLAGIAVLSLVLFRNRPTEVGLPPVEEYHENHTAQQEVSREDINIWQNTKEVLKEWPVWVLAFSYLGVKSIRYSFLFWSVTYLTQAKGFATADAGYISSLYALVGLFGTLLASYLTDKVFASRRAPISVIMLLGLTLALFFFLKAPNSLIPLAIGLVGFMNYGPDIVISGVAVMDFGSRKGAGTAAGFVNGIGSFGQVLSGIVVGVVSSQFGWNAVFYVLIVVALLCALLLSTLWNKVGSN